MVSTILVPLDGSDLASRVLPFAAWCARPEGAAPLLVHAALDIDETEVPQAALLPALQAREVIDRLEAVAELATVAEEMREQKISVDISVRPGDAARVILETANLRDVAPIVMSAHGRGALSQWPVRGRSCSWSSGPGSCCWPAWSKASSRRPTFRVPDVSICQSGRSPGPTSARTGADPILPALAPTRESP